MATRTRLKVEGVGRLAITLSSIDNVSRKEERREVHVGYAAPYAIYVHENMQMKLAGQPRPSGIGIYWGRPWAFGQSKFLEQPARELVGKIGKRIAEVTKKTHRFSLGLFSGGVLLRDASLDLVPVEHGRLRDSAFVKTV